MKKVLSVLLALMLVITALPTFAASSAVGQTEYADGIEYEYSIVSYANGMANNSEAPDDSYFPWYVSGSGSSRVKSGGGVSTNSGAYLIFKLPLPKLSQEQVISNYKFNFATNTKTGNVGGSYSIARLPDNMEEMLSENLKTSDSVIADSKANSAMSSLEAIQVEGTEYYHYQADITAFANESYLKGLDHCYIMIWSASTYKFMWSDSSYAESQKPYCYFTAGSALSTELALSSSNVKDGDMAVSVNDPIEFYYNKPVASATAVINDEETPCTISGGKVSVNPAMATGSTYTLTVNTSDSEGNAVETTLSFSTYGELRAHSGPYGIGATGTTLVTGKLSVHKSGYVLYKLPMPKLEPGQKIDKYIFRQYTAIYSGGNYFAFDQIEETYTGGVFDEATYDAEILKFTTADIPDTKVDIKKSVTSTLLDFTISNSWKSYRNDVDITDYVIECYNAGQREYFLIGYNHNSTTSTYNVNYSTLANNGCYTYGYYALGVADPLALYKSVPEEGGVIATEANNLSVVFNNGIETASAKLNGEDVDATVSGATVSVIETLAQYTDYALEVTATDVYGTTETVTVNFATKGATETEVLRDGTSYWITADADPEEGYTAKKNIDKRASHFMVFRMPVPYIPEGQILDTFMFNITAFSQAANGLFKLPGDDWEFTEDKNGDGQLMRFGDEDVQALMDTTNNTPCPNSERTSVCLNPEADKNLLFAQSYDIAGYVNECIARGESYVDVGVIAPASTMDLYGFLSEGWSSAYRAYYTYSTAVPEFKVVDAKTTVTGENLRGLSVKLLTTVNSANEKVVVRDAETKTPVSVPLTYDSNKREVKLANVTALPKNSSFEVVLVPCTDTYGNSIDEEVVLATFETTFNYAFSDVKLVEADSEAAYDEADAFVSVVAGTECKALSKVTNNSGATYGLKVCVAQYNGNKLEAVKIYTVGVANGSNGANAATESFAVEEGVTSVKAFLIEGVKPLAGYAEVTVEQ